MKIDSKNDEFWAALDELVSKSEIVIDRPKGSAHPRFPDFIYRVDYGYLKDTASMDGAGIDVAPSFFSHSFEMLICCSSHQAFPSFACDHQIPLGASLSAALSSVYRR